MLDQLATFAGYSTLVADQQVALCGIGTAVPPHALPQDMVERRARAVLGPRYPQFERLAPAFANSGVETRYAIVSPDWFEQPHGWSDRNATYLAGATRLFIDAASAALADAGMTAAEVDCIVTVSSTGIATPSLEAQAAAEMGFRADVKRVPVFGLGCAGGVTGLALAARLARATPGTRVLMVAVEACSMAFRDDRLSKADIIAMILFGDGAAAAVLSTLPTAGSGSRVTLGEGQEYMWPDTLAIMGWDVDDAGLGVIFDRSIPTFAAAHFRAATDDMLAHAGLTVADIDRFVCHPGGAKVVTALEEALDLEPASLDAERAVLRDAGNMSAPTGLFVLQRVLAEGQTGQLALCALGPGFTASLLPLTVTSADG